MDNFDCTILRITFADWLSTGEPTFFGVVDELGDGEGLFIQDIPSLFPYLSTVAMVRVDGALYKLNGSRRKRAWLNGAMESPAFLNALVFEMPTADFLRLVNRAKGMAFDALPTHEVVKLAYAELGLVFLSDRLRNGFINEALHIALRGRPRRLQDKRSIKEREDIDIKKAIGLFKDELKLIDGIEPKADVFTTGVLAGALLMLALNKPVEGFLKDLNDDAGRERNGQYDPVESLQRSIRRHRISSGATSQRMAVDLCKKTIHAMQIWLEGDHSARYWRMKDLSGHDLMPVIIEMKLLRRINAERDL